VLQAYSNPVVNKSDTPFTWGEPDVEAISAYCFERASWSYNDVERIVNPAIDKMRKERGQTRIDSFFMTHQDNIKFAVVNSKRLKQVMSEASGKQDIADKQLTKKRNSKKQKGERLSKHTSAETNREGTFNNDAPPPTKRKKPKKAKMPSKSARSQEKKAAGASNTEGTNTQLDTVIGNARKRQKLKAATNTRKARRTKTPQDTTDK